MATPSSDVASLVESRLPVKVDSDGSQDDWKIVGPAMLVASTRHLRAIEHLQEEFPSGVVLWQLLRSLFEYVTTFAWVAADPDTRVKRWLKYDFDQRMKLDNDLEQVGAELLLDPAVRAQLEAYEPELDAMPPLPQRAREADEKWQETIARLIDELGAGFPTSTSSSDFYTPGSTGTAAGSRTQAHTLCKRSRTGAHRPSIWEMSG